MKFPFGSRVRAMREDARASLAMSQRQLDEAIAGHEDAMAISDRLRDIRAKNHFAAAIEFHLRGARI